MSRGHATLHLAVSVGTSRRYVGRLVKFFNCEWFLHYCSCPTVHDWIAVYPALFCWSPDTSIVCLSNLFQKILLSNMKLISFKLILLLALLPHAKKQKRITTKETYINKNNNGEQSKWLGNIERTILSSWIWSKRKNGVSKVLNLIFL